MKDKYSKEKLQKVQRQLKITSILAIVAFSLFIIILVNPDLSFDKEESADTIENVETDFDKIENGIHTATGFIANEGYQTVIQNCTSCHSSQLVIQNRMNKERWNATIKWMQETQNLWDLGVNQEIIVNYLVANYPPVEKGRRANLKIENWYELE